MSWDDAERLLGLPPADDDQAAERAGELGTIRGDPRDLARSAVACLDLTSLTGEETPETVDELCARAMASEPRVAAVCLFPQHVRRARAALAGSGVRVATVAGDFPAGTAPLASKLAEIEQALAVGADEVDVVLDRRPMLTGDPRPAFEETSALRAAARGATLKVILETGALGGAEACRRAALATLAAGADFVKTSTGKAAVGATLSAALLLSEAVRDLGVPAGVKVSGGIRGADEALRYAALHSAVLGELSPRRFRIGASSLLEELHRRLASIEERDGG